MKTRLTFFQLFAWAAVGSGFSQTFPAIFAPEKVIQAGSGALAPADSVAARVDANTTSSSFAGVGSLSITSGGTTLTGTAVAISPWFVLTAGHNLDTNDNGVVDPGIRITFNLNAGGSPSQSISATGFNLNPTFTGFLNPTVNGDLGLLRLSQALPPSVPTYSLWTRSVSAGQTFTVVGYGESGSGDTGYTVGSSLTIKRVGGNVVDSFQQVGGKNEVFIYDFDSPGTFGQVGGSLGNGIETIIGRGDSGSPMFISSGGQYFVAGINTFTMGGNNGRYGDQGGGILLEPHLLWISSTIAVPEPSTFALLGGGVIAMIFARRRRLRQRSVAPCPPQRDRRRSTL